MATAPGNSQRDNSYLAMVGDVKAELTRLQVQHRWIQTSTKDKIAFAPIDLTKDGLKVLDIGCADAQGNIRYVTQDVCDPPAEELKAQFDLTHVRNVLHSSHRSGIEQAVANLSGGWLQVMELDITPDPPRQPQALQDLIHIIGYMFEKQGMDRDYARKIPGSMTKAGLQNVTVESVECGIGKVLGDETAIKLSIEPFMYTIPLVARNANLMCPDLDPRVVADLENRYVKEMNEQGGYFPAKIYYAQKPLA
ncbi:methyltransferase psoC [Colletotrichum spaethianum]|uniref:Methyltransferase psoC n=1 Tax=Colletotrichum spaethianum TaxID=700344 RepID=A0AA37L804_9PEZI|nr:methyltransferase psoC [Colletotrichum spaethianum]GKT43486.1 methyltransferase psoC [Colletotrichum spaethianum]